MTDEQKTSVWEMIDYGIAGSNVDLVIENENCKVMKLADDTGEGLMTMYRVFDGVYLMFNDFHMEYCFSGFQNCESLLAVDHCREGCIEMDLEDDRCCCLNQGEMRIDTRVHHKGQVRFPLKHYHGITIGFQTGLAEQSIQEMMPAFHIDVEALLQKFCRANGLCVLPGDASIDNLFTQLYRLPKKAQMDYFKVKVMELLIYLDGIDFEQTAASSQPYFYKSQVEKIHGICDLITEDLQVSYTQEELAQRFDIGLTPMKKCFKSVYGQSIYRYLKEYRMNRAAELLLTEREKKVSDIAADCGYENPGKFGKVFREQFGVSPLEYRKSNGRREISHGEKAKAKEYI